jgi:predicted PurR-regulated permease PerM
MDDPSGPRSPPAAGEATFGTRDPQFIARISLVVALCALGLWLLSGLLPAILWAVVLAISTWPVRENLARRTGETTAAAVLTAVVAVGFILPLLLVAIQGAREAVLVLQWIRELRQHGLETPAWIAQLPVVGPFIGNWWQENLSDPETARALFGRAGSVEVLNWTRTLGRQFASRLAILGFTLLVLFFLYRDGTVLVDESRWIGGRLFGPPAKRLGANAVATVRATVNGLVFVGLGEGVFMGLLYVLAGLPHPLAFALATGVFAIIPFGAPAVFVFAAVLLAAQSQFTAAMLILVAGFLMLFVADHVIRPLLIGSATRLPFLLVLLGIFGGLETFGLIGLFLGPAILSVLFAIWKESVEPINETSASAS